MSDVLDCRGVPIRPGLTVVYPTQYGARTTSLVQAVVLDPMVSPSGRIRLRAVFRPHGYDFSRDEVIVRPDRIMVVTLPEAS